MLGNDIVDLAEAQRSCDWRRPRYLEKVFTSLEQEWILSATNPDEWVWLLWSAKESAYKLCRRLGAEQAYAPKKLAIQSWKRLESNTYELHLQNEQRELLIVGELRDAYVHSVAMTMYNENRRQNIISITNHHAVQSEALRAHICQELIQTYGCRSDKEYRVEKDNDGIPWVYLGQERLDIALSLSHHGSFGAYTWIEQSIPLHR